MRLLLTRRNTGLHIPDGINVAMHALADGLIGLGHEVFMLGPTCDMAQVTRNFYAHRRPEWRGLVEEDVATYSASLRVWLQMGRAAVREIAPDVILNNGALPFRLSSCPEYALVHDLERGGRGGTILGNVYRLASYGQQTKVVATCTEIADGLRSTRLLARSVGKGPVAIVPNGVVLEGRPCHSARSRPGDTILHMGTASYKCPEVSIAAFAAISSEFPRYRLVISGPRSANVARLISEQPAHVQSRISLPGVLDIGPLLELIASSAVVLVPSKYRVPVASPTVLDALAAGTPVVCTSISKDILGQDNSCGYLISNVGSVPDFSDALRTVLADPDRWLLLSAGAAKNAARFEAGVVADRLLSAIA